MSECLVGLRAHLRVPVRLPSCVRLMSLQTQADPPLQEGGWGSESAPPGMQAESGARGGHCPQRPFLARPRGDSRSLASSPAAQTCSVSSAGSVARTLTSCLCRQVAELGADLSDVAGSPRPSHCLHHTLPCGHTTNAQTPFSLTHNLLQFQTSLRAQPLQDSLGSAVQSSRLISSSALSCREKMII